MTKDDPTLLMTKPATLDRLDTSDLSDQTVRVLVIDKEPYFLETAVSNIEAEKQHRPNPEHCPKLAFITAQDLPEASGHLRQNQVDVILAQADDIDGIVQLQSGTVTPPILALTRTNAIDITRRAMAAGAEDVLLPSDLLQTTTFRHRIMLAITRSMLEQKRLHHAREDKLTGLANSLLLEERFARALARADRYATLVGLVAIDLDEFDTLSARYGQSITDHLLSEVGQRLSGEARKTDTLARTRHHGFTWLVEGLVAIDDIGALVDRLPNRLARPLNILGQDIRITVSAGVAIAPFHGREFQTVLKKAEAAMIDVSNISGDALLMLPVPKNTGSAPIEAMT